MSTVNPSKLSGQRILLIGGTGGVGLTVARLLLAHNATVILSSSRQKKLDSCIAILQSEHSNMKAQITGLACDLASTDVEDNIIALFKQVGTIDHLVYMAGDRLPMLPLTEITLEKWQQCSQVRTIASILVAKHAVKHLDKSPSSNIVFTGGSICDKPIAGGWSMLALIGAGINGLTRQPAFDLGPLRVNCVAPGVVETDLWDGMGDARKKTFFKDHESKIPTGKVAQPEDVAEAYVYLLKDRNATRLTVHTNSGVFLQ